MGTRITLLSFLRSVYVPSRLELSDNHVRQMEITVRAFGQWLGRDATIADLSEDTARGFLAAYRRDHAAATTNSKRCQLLAIWQCAFDEELLERPPRRSKVRRASPEPKTPEAWTPSDVAAIIASASQETRPIDGIPAAEWWRALLMVLYDTGERRGAALALEPTDLDIETGDVVFRRTKSRRERWCRLASDTLAACRRIYDPTRSLVWPWPWSREYLDKTLRRILTRAGVRWGPCRGGSLHKFRRTSGTLVEQAGGDGAKHLGNSRAVFDRHYRDPRFFHSSVDLLPRPG